MLEFAPPRGYSAEMTLYPLPASRHQRRLPAVEEISAGGVVIDVAHGRAYIALIARHNRAGRLEWCLPKGHVEPGETLTETAVREVEEETGIMGRALLTLGTIDYWFSTPQFRIHKRVHHYLLEALGGEISIENDPDHEAIDAQWFLLEDVAARLTFPNERRIAHTAWEHLAGTA